MKLRAFAVLASLLVASPALAFPGLTESPCDQSPPKSAQKPVTELFIVYDVPGDDMNNQCNKKPGPILFGCTVFSDGDHPDLILLNDKLTAAEKVCVLLYEKAHLPPNNWADLAVESLLIDK